MTIRFVKRSPMRVSAASLYRWHMRPGAFEQLVPPWQDVRLLSQTGPSDEAGTRLFLSVPFGPFRRLWVAEHRDIIVGRQFVDVQIRGPFAWWEHTHRFLDREPEGSFLEDVVECGLPFGRLGEGLAGWLVRRQLKRVFDYRHEITAAAVSSGPEAPAHEGPATGR